MNYLISFIISFMFGACTLVIGVQNPIHSILILISVFFFGSVLLFILQVEYFALLFMIVYVGAIVVLFLFIVMMLEIKMVNTSQRFKDLFSYKGLIILFLTLEILLLISQDLFELSSIFANNTISNINQLNEVNLSVDYSNLLQRLDHLKGIGGVLFTEYKLTVIIASLLLFLSMIGSIVLTIESGSVQTLKNQDANYQALRHPKLSRNSLRFL